MRPQPICKVQLILPPSKRPDTNVAKLARWPQPLAIIPICEPFRRPMNICSQKGCIWRSEPDGGCVFCSIPYESLHARNPRLVWDEIRLLADTYVADFIWDPSDNLVGDREWFRQFCATKPAELKIPYTTYVDAKVVDEEVGESLAQSGCCATTPPSGTSTGISATPTTPTAC